MNKYIIIIILLFSGFFLDISAQVVETNELTKEDSTILKIKDFTLEMYNNHGITNNFIIFKEHKIIMVGEDGNDVLKIYNYTGLLQKELVIKSGTGTHGMYLYSTDQYCYLLYGKKTFRISIESDMSVNISSQERLINKHIVYDKTLFFGNHIIYTVANIGSSFSKKCLFNNSMGKVQTGDGIEIYNSNPQPGENVVPRTYDQVLPLDIFVINNKLVVYDSYLFKIAVFDKDLKLEKEINLANKFKEYEEAEYKQYKKGGYLVCEPKIYSLLVKDYVTGSLYLFVNKLGFGFYANKTFSIYKIKTDEDFNNIELVPVQYEDDPLIYPVQIYSNKIYAVIERLRTCAIYSSPVRLDQNK